jgi:GxxExxY protein
MDEPSALLDELARRFLAVAGEVHRQLGPGFAEAVYENAVCIELSRHGIPFARQVTMPITYKGEPIGEVRVDLVIADRLIVELKSVDALATVHTAQVLAYLRATSRQLALLVNFNVPKLPFGTKRVVLTARPESP